MSAERGACYPPSANDVRLLRLANSDGWREGCVYTSGRLGLVARQTRKTSGLAVAALVAQSIFLGFNWVVMKVGLRYAALWPFVALRTGLGAMALLLLLAILRRPFWPQMPLLTVVLGLLQTTAQVGLLMWALESGSAGRTSALVYTMPFWALLFAWIFLGERIAGLQWLAIALALIGLVAILDPQNLRGSWESKALAVGAGFAWAASAIVAKRINRRGSVDVLNLTAWQMFFGAIPIVIVAAIVPAHRIEWSLAFVGALVYNVVPATAIAWFLWLYVLQVLPAGVAGIGTLFTPVIGVAASSLLLREQLATLEAVGIGLVLLALFLLTLRGILAHHHACSLPVEEMR